MIIAWSAGGDYFSPLYISLSRFRFGLRLCIALLPASCLGRRSASKDLFLGSQGLICSNWDFEKARKAEDSLSACSYDAELSLRALRWKVFWARAKILMVSKINHDYSVSWVQKLFNWLGKADKPRYTVLSLDWLIDCSIDWLIDWWKNDLLILLTYSNAYINLWLLWIEKSFLKKNWSFSLVFQPLSNSTPKWSCSKAKSVTVDFFRHLPFWNDFFTTAQKPVMPVRSVACSLLFLAKVNVPSSYF